MSMKILQFPEQGSTRAIRVHAIPEAWVKAYGASGGNGFLSSCFTDDCESDYVQEGVNWGALSGLALSLTVSAAFWAGVGLIVERLLR